MRGGSFARPPYTLRWIWIFTSHCGSGTVRFGCCRRTKLSKLRTCFSQWSTHQREGVVCRPCAGLPNWSTRSWSPVTYRTSVTSFVALTWVPDRRNNDPPPQCEYDVSNAFKTLPRRIVASLGLMKRSSFWPRHLDEEAGGNTTWHMRFADSEQSPPWFVPGRAPA